MMIIVNFEARLLTSCSHQHSDPQAGAADEVVAC